MSNSLFADLAGLTGNEFLQKLDQTDLGNSIGNALSSKIQKKITAPRSTASVTEDKIDYTKPSEIIESKSGLIYIVGGLVVLLGVFFVMRRK